MVLTRYRDVAQALRDPRFEIVGGSVDPKAHRDMREHARSLYSKDWSAGFKTRAAEFSIRHEVVEDFAQPWSLAVAELVTGIERASEHTSAAQAIFDSGAAPGDDALAAEARNATLSLSSKFPPTVAALHTQAFVALAVSLPAFLGNASLALLQHPAQSDHIGSPTAVDELLRFAGPSTKQLRTIHDEHIELHLAQANRDPDQFEDPHRLDLRRRNAAEHLAFGGGPHVCAGAALIKSATRAVLPLLAERLSKVRLDKAEPYGGAAIRGHRVYVI